jgi:RHS repeat-associated protein
MSKGKRYYYHYDGLGSVSEITNENGEVVEQYEYSVFGKPVIKDSKGTVLTESKIGNIFMYTGRKYITETGLYDYRRRTYSPELGRFLQRDPLGFGDDVNLYRYVGNNPVNYVDPWGLSAEKRHRELGEFVEGGSSARGIAASIVVEENPNVAVDAGMVILKSVNTYFSNLASGGTKTTLQLAGISLELPRYYYMYENMTAQRAQLACEIHIYGMVAKALGTAAGAYAGKMLRGGKHGMAIGAAIGGTISSRIVNNLEIKLYNFIVNKCGY